MPIGRPASRAIAAALTLENPVVGAAYALDMNTVASIIPMECLGMVLELPRFPKK